MESKPLKRTMLMILDTRGMEGPVTLRGLAEEVMRCALPDEWSASDEYAARLAYLKRGYKGLMNESLSADFIERHLIHIPEELRDTLRRFPRFICISPGGGRGSEHVMTLNATKEQWEANISLKSHIMQATRMSRDESRDIRHLLVATGAGCLADLLNSEKAA